MRKIAQHLLVLSCLLPGSVALAGSRICGDLQARLADLPETVTTVPAAPGLADKIARQEFRIRQIEAEFSDRRCDAYSSVSQADRASTCDSLDMSRQQMRDDLRYLRERQGRLAQADPYAGKRSALVAELQENDCDLPLSAETDVMSTNPRHAIGRDDAPPDYDLDRQSETATMAEPAQQSPWLNNPYDHLDRIFADAGSRSVQTVCVRTCDGGFFPLTNAAKPGNINADADRCAQMCPGVQTELFFRYIPGDESADMRSATTGAPYSAMPYAFAYKKRSTSEKPECACKFNAYYREIQRQEEGKEGPGSDTASSIISLGDPGKHDHSGPKQTAPERPATVPQIAAPPDRPYDPDSRKVRQVGPRFLADEKPVDLTRPALQGPQPEQ